MVDCGITKNDIQVTRLLTIVQNWSKFLSNVKYLQEQLTSCMCGDEGEINFMGQKKKKKWQSEQVV